MVRPYQPKSGLFFKPALVILLLSGFAFSFGCGPRQFSKGSYDEDINRANLLSDGWSESDMQQAVKDLVASAKNHPEIRRATKPPVVLVTRIENKTSEHIDTQSVADMLRVELMRGGEVQFVDGEAREDIATEYEYQGSGKVSAESKKGPGGQIGADLIMNGRLDSIVQTVGKDKTVFYKLTLNMTNLKTGVIVWSDHKQLRKIFRKRTVGF